MKGGRVASAEELTRFLLAIGDDTLVMSERTSELMMRAPTLEEELALANIALDLLGQARSWLSYAGQVEGAGRDEDQLAYLRGESDYRNCHLVELPNGDFAVTVVRLLFVATYLHLLFERLCDSRDETVAAIAAKAVKEQAYHREHAVLWVRILSEGTDVSRAKVAAALAALLPYVGELFEHQEDEAALVAAGVTVERPLLEDPWWALIRPAFAAADVTELTPPWQAGGGRRGHHTEHLAEVLSRMQSVHRAFPGASW